MPTLASDAIAGICALADGDALAGMSLTGAVSRMADSGIGWIQIRVALARESA